MSVVVEAIIIVMSVVVEVMIIGTSVVLEMVAMALVVIFGMSVVVEVIIIVVSVMMIVILVDQDRALLQIGVVLLHLIDVNSCIVIDNHLLLTITYLKRKKNEIVMVVIPYDFFLS
jgi:hypothetical protein